MSKAYEQFKECVYGSICAYKNSEITTEKGLYKGKPKDVILPESYCEGKTTPAMLYDGIRECYDKMQSSKFKYKLHLMALKHIASSQTACINLFMPILMSDNVDAILKESGVAPADFKCIDTDRLYKGFCFEFWNSTDKKSKGLLNDHTQGAGTDADVAIAYINKEEKHCLWLIEHKLTEQEFTTCGGYRSKGNSEEGKEKCKSCSMNDIMNDPSLCYYADKCGYKYWDLKNVGAKDLFCGKYNGEGCPFRGGMNQLWRNQLLAMAIEKDVKKEYEHVSFSVVYHPKNPSLSTTIANYKELTNNNPVFSAFTSDKLVDAASEFEGMKDWVDWYRKVYNI